MHLVHNVFTRTNRSSSAKLQNMEASSNDEHGSGLASRKHAQRTNLQLNEQIRKSTSNIDNCIKKVIPQS